MMGHMSPSLREQRKADTSARIATAALELFAERGYADVTVGEVAAAAGVGERTLYRYFADKDDLLFAGDEQMRAALGSAMDQQPDGRAPFTVLLEAGVAVARTLEDRRDEVARRADIISASPALTARERAKHVTWEAVLARSLVRRGVDPVEAALLGRVAVVCYDEAMARWLAQEGPRRALEPELEATFARLAALVVDDGLTRVARTGGHAP